MTTMKQWMKWATAATLGLLLCACLTQPAGAAITRNIPVTEGEPCSLTLDFKVPGVTFHLYRVASVSADVRYRLLPTIANDSNCPQMQDINTIASAGQWSDLLTTLRPYLARYFTPMRSGVTDAHGSLTFENLPVGLYLVTGEQYPVTGRDGRTRYYQPADYFVCLPYWTESGSQEAFWEYHLAVDRTKQSEVPYEPIDRRVIKVWNKGTSPAPVTVELLQNGHVYQTVTLNEGNNWRYTWTGLDPAYRWEILERNASNYQVSITQTGGTCRILNSIKEPPKRDDEGRGGETPLPPDIPLEDPEVPLSSYDPEQPDFDPEDEIELEDPDVPLAQLPQTGQLWWPVPLLALAGMALFFLGWGRHRMEEDDGE